MYYQLGIFELLNCFLSHSLNLKFFEHVQLFIFISMESIFTQNKMFL